MKSIANFVKVDEKDFSESVNAFLPQSVVVPVNHHGLHELAPVAHGLPLEAELLQQVHRVERLDDEHSALDGDVGLGLAFELQFALVLQHIHDLDIHLVLELVLERGLEVGLVPHAHEGDVVNGRVRVLLLPGIVDVVGKVGDKSFEVGAGCDAVGGQDLHHPAIELAIEARPG